MAIWVEVLSSIGTQDTFTSWHPVSDLEDIEFHRRQPELILDPVFRPRRETPFSPSTFNDFEMGQVVENEIRPENE